MEFKFDEMMTFEDVSQAIEAHAKALRYLQNELPKACQREGHRWSKPKRDDICEDPGDYVEGYACNGEDRGSAGYYRRSPTYSTAYSRTCERCGVKERRRAITTVKSPFE